MKLFNTLAVAAALLAGTAAQAQTAEEIVAKHNDAVGGVALWKKVNSMKMTGNVNAQGADVDVTTSLIKDKGMRVDFKVMGTENYFIMTPTAGWIFIPAQQMTKPQPMTPDMIKANKDEYVIMDELVDYASRGSKVELVDKEDVEGTECFKLKVTKKNGDIVNDFVDAKTFYIIRETSKKTVDGKEQESIENFGNYQKIPEGIVVAMTQDTDFGPMSVKAVEVNTLKDESIFKPSAN